MQVNLSQLLERPGFLPLFNEWEKLRGKRIALTGHRGVLGSLLMGRFQNAGVHVDTYMGDVMDGKKLIRWIHASQPDALFHLAAVVPLAQVAADPVAAMRINAVSALDIHAAISSHTPDCWIFLASSSHVYTPQVGEAIEKRIHESTATFPASLYGATKLAAENIISPLAANSGSALCIGRIFSYFHERQPDSFFVPGLVRRIDGTADFNPVEIHDSSSIRDFLYAESVVDAILFLCARRSSTTVNIGSGVGRSVGAVAEIVLAASKRSHTLRHLNSPVPNGLVADIERLKSIISPQSGA